MRRIPKIYKKNFAHGAEYTPNDVLNSGGIYISPLFLKMSTFRRLCDENHIYDNSCFGKGFGGTPSTYTNDAKLMQGFF